MDLELVLEEKGIAFAENKSFKELTSFKTGGECRYAVYPDCVEEVIFLRTLAKENNIPLIVLGKGTNVLAPDESFEGMVLVTKERFNSLKREGNVIEACCGASLSSICTEAKDASLTGMEFAYGIPGSCGGAVLMNAGAYGGEVKDVITSVTYLDEKNELHTVSNEECNFSYRTSLFDKNDYFVVSVNFTLTEGQKEKIEAKMTEVLEKRRSKQPLEYPSGGSTFKRPEGYFAAALIEECNLKGFGVGGAEVSTKHSGFVINKGNATSNDVKELCRRIKEIVLREKGVKLETEIRFL